MSPDIAQCPLGYSWGWAKSSLVEIHYLCRWYWRQNSKFNLCDSKAPVLFPIAFPESTWNCTFQEPRSVLGSWLVPDPISRRGSWWLFHSLKVLWGLSQKIISPAFDEKVEDIQYFFIFLFVPYSPHTAPKHVVYLSNDSSLHLPVVAEASCGVIELWVWT